MDNDMSQLLGNISSSIEETLKVLNTSTVGELISSGYVTESDSSEATTKEIMDPHSVDEVHEDDYYSKTQNERIAQLKESSTRDKLFNEFLKNYINDYKLKSEQKRFFKKVFFICIIVLICIIPISCIVLIVVALNSSENAISSAITAITFVVESITSFLVLPKIIAKYLFDKKEDESLANIISSMQEYNLESKRRTNNNEDNK